jgi:GNAT superfamily N-acetyltransferase
MMNIRYNSEMPSSEQAFVLFENTGWNEAYKITESEYKQVLLASWHVVCTYDGEKLVGIGRMTSDGIVHAMIYDMIVDPAYQRQGIGTEILKRLVDFCCSQRIRDVQLFCARGKRIFYEKNGFTARLDDAPGMQYRPDYGL